MNQNDIKSLFPDFAKVKELDKIKLVKSKFSTIIYLAALYDMKSQKKRFHRTRRHFLVQDLVF